MSIHSLLSLSSVQERDQGELNGVSRAKGRHAREGAVVAMVEPGRRGQRGGGGWVGEGSRGGRGRWDKSEGG